MKSFRFGSAVRALAPRGRIGRLFPALVVAILVAACSDSSGPDMLTSLTISPATATVAVNGTVNFAVAGTRADIDVTNLKGAVWTVTGGGTVSSEGLFTAPATPGTSTVTVACGGRTAVATVTVTAGPLATITITPNPATLAIGAQQQFTAVGRDAAGNVVAITPVWTAASAAGTINASTGLFTAGNTSGTFPEGVRATSGTITATATVIVTPGALVSITVTPDPATLGVGAQQQFTAVGRDARGNVVPITPVWTAASAAGTINPATGLFTAGNTAGTFPAGVRATSGTITATATVIVTAGALATITVTPDPATLAVGAQQQFTAVGRDAAGNVVPITPIWTAASAAGTINASTGLFTAGTTPGTFPQGVRATSGSITATATVIVTAGPLATITVTPDPATLAVGAQQQFTAVGRDANGNVVPITPIWTAASAAGTINASTGLFTAGNTAGTFPQGVRATSGTITATATVIVTAGPLATITVTPDPATLAVGAQQQFTAVGRDANGNVVAITPIWTAASAAGTINSSTGLFTAGTTTGTFAQGVRATSGTITATATVIVTAGPLATITVTPDPATLAVGAQQQFTAVGRDANGNVVAITPVWTAASAAGTINSSTGLFTAGNTTGTFAQGVRATSGTITATATVIVTAGPLATITVTPNPVTLAAGAQQQFTAVGRDASGNAVAITPVWSTTNPPGTINSSTGLFTAGNTAGTFTNSVRATSGSIFGTATVTVTTGGGATPPLPPAAATFRVLANRSVACTDGSITGDVGTFQAAPTGSFTPVNCPVAGGTAQIGTAASIAAYNSFVSAYDAAATQPCGTVLTGSLAGQILAPGVYCFTAAASLTGTLTLNGPPNGVWLFRIGTSGVGGLSATNFSVVMAGGASACNVTWRVQDAATTTDTNFRGAILAGGNVTSTRGTLNGNLWSQGDVTITGTVLTAC
jgi:hypothetical protein